MVALILGLLVALVLFWAVGAHNRLVRLRSEVIRQWSSVDAVWLRLLVRLQGGIAARQFQRTFLLAEGMQVLGADLKNGLLSVDLARPEPERIIRKIDIAQRD